MSASSITVELAAMKAQALAAWRRLTEAQRTALRRSTAYLDTGRHRLSSDTHARCVAALAGHRLANVDRWLTFEGQLVRAAGIEADAAAAKRRYRKRGAR